MQMFVCLSDEKGFSAQELTIFIFLSQVGLSSQSQVSNRSLSSCFFGQMEPRILRLVLIVNTDDVDKAGCHTSTPGYPSWPHTTAAFLRPQLSSQTGFPSTNTFPS